MIDSSQLIEASGISVTHKEGKVLDDVSLSIGKRDFITVVGPNGAGKSILLKCLLGFYLPDSGYIKRKRRLRVGYMPQHFVINHTIPITVYRFLTLCNKVDKQDIEQIARETAIDKILAKPLHVLSGGELQCVLLTRALLGSPQLLVLDEPAQNLDISGQLAFYRLLERIYSERQLSILMVSHDLHIVMASTKHVVCLFHHICCSGEPHIVTNDPEFIALFGKDMANMMAVYQHSHNHNHAGKYRA